MSKVVPLRPEQPADLRCRGVSRDAGNDQSLAVAFNRRVTDAEMRFLREVLERAVICLPDDLES